MENFSKHIHINREHKGSLQSWKESGNGMMYTKFTLSYINIIRDMIYKMMTIDNNKVSYT